MVNLIDLHQYDYYLRGTKPFLLDWKEIRTYWRKTFSNSNWVYIWDNWLKTLHSFFRGFLCYFIVLRFFLGEPLCYKIRTNAPYRNTVEPPTTILTQGTRLNKTPSDNRSRAARGSWFLAGVFPREPRGVPPRDGANRRASSHIGGGLRGRHSWCFGGRRLLPQTRRLMKSSAEKLWWQLEAWITNVLPVENLEPVSPAIKQ